MHGLQIATFPKPIEITQFLGNPKILDKKII